MDIRNKGYVFTDDEMFKFYNHFYAALQKKLASVKAEESSIKDNHLRDELTEQCQHLCVASNILGDPDSRRSPVQASFRRHLCIICEGAGVDNCCLIMFDDCCFLDAIVGSNMVKVLYEKCIRNRL